MAQYFFYGYVYGSFLGFTVLQDDIEFKGGGENGKDNFFGTTAAATP
jgi:hypothetical protein